MNNLQALTGGANLATSNLASSAISDINILIGSNGGGKTTLLNRLRDQIIMGRENSDLNTQVALIKEGAEFDSDYWVSYEWSRIIRKDPYYLSKSLALIQDSYPIVESLFISDFDDELYAKLDDNLISAYGMGAGFQALSTIAAALFIGKGGFACIDNLGQGLHIDKSESVARFIIEDALKNNTQVFVSTHCPSVLSAFQTVCKELDTHLTLINVKSAYQLPNDVIDVEVLT